MFSFAGLIENLGLGAYVVIFIGALLECAGFLGLFVPGEALVMIGGFLVASEILDVKVLLPLVAAGAFAGNVIGFELGRRLGREWLLRHTRWTRLDAERIEGIEQFFHSHGGKTVLIARFTAILRAFVPFIAGTVHMRFRDFLFFSFIGAAAWSCCFVTAGYLIGRGWSRLHGLLGGAGLILTGVAVVAITSYYLWHRRGRSRAGKPRRV